MKVARPPAPTSPHSPLCRPTEHAAASPFPPFPEQNAAHGHTAPSQKWAGFSWRGWVSLTSPCPAFSELLDSPRAPNSGLSWGLWGDVLNTSTWSLPTLPTPLPFVHSRLLKSSLKDTEELCLPVPAFLLSQALISLRLSSVSLERHLLACESVVCS